MKRRRILEAIDSGVSFRFSRSAGAGGQNVNKLNTRVTARLALSSLTVLDDDELSRLESRLASRINASREIYLHVQEERSQARNRAIALRRMRSLVLGALSTGRYRRPTAPTGRAKAKRLDAKRRRGLTKRGRRKPDRDE